MLALSRLGREPLLRDYSHVPVAVEVTTRTLTYDRPSSRRKSSVRTSRRVGGPRDVPAHSRLDAPAMKVCGDGRAMDAEATSEGVGGLAPSVGIDKVINLRRP